MPSDYKRFLATRPVVGAVSIACACLVTVVGLAVGISVVRSNAAAELADAKVQLERYTYTWQTRVGTRLSEASSLAAAAASFAAGGATSAPNHTDPSVSNRIRFINNASWPIASSSLFAQVPGVLSIQLQPSGIIAQIWPPDSAPLGLDTWNLDYLHESYVNFARGGKPLTVGPLPLVQGGIGLLVRYPVYVDAHRDRLEAFWGAGVVVFRVVDMLAAMNFSESHLEDGYDVVCYAKDVSNETAPLSIITGVVPDGGVHTKDSFTVRINTADPDNALFLSATRSGGMPSGGIDARGVVAVIVPTVIVALLSAAIVLAVTTLTFRLKHRHVPATSGDEVTAMALVSLQRLGYWTERLTPEQLASHLLAFEHAVGAIAASHRCHLSGRISDGCCLVVGASGPGIVKFARSAKRRLPAEFSASRLCIPTVATNTSVNGVGAAGETSTNKETGFEFAVCMHAGSLRSTYDPDVDRYSFFGPGVASAAIGVDATLPNEVTATAAFAEATAWRLVPRDSPVRRLDEDDDETVLYILNDEVMLDESLRSHQMRRPSSNNGTGAALDDLVAPSASSGRNSPATGGPPNGGDIGSSVASAVSAKTGVAVRRRLGLLVFEILPFDGWGQSDRAPPIPNFTEVLETIATIAVKHNGMVASIVGGRVVIAFNALRAVASPSRGAANADVDIRHALTGHRIVSVVTQGFAHVAVTTGSLLVCIGDPVQRARSLLNEAVAINALDHVLESAALTESATAAELRQAFELQCIGQSAADGVGLRYVLERAWPERTRDGTHDWLHELQRLESRSRFTPLNFALEALAVDPANERHRATGKSLIGAAQRHGGLFHPLAIAALRTAIVEGGASLAPSTVRHPAASSNPNQQPSGIAAGARANRHEQQQSPGLFFAPSSASGSGKDRGASLPHAAVNVNPGAASSGGSTGATSDGPATLSQSGGVEPRDA